MAWKKTDLVAVTTERVRALLATKRGVVERKMMGKLAFMVSGSMCCTVGPEGLLVGVTPDERDEVLSKKHVKPMMMRGRPMTSFVRISHEGIRTEAMLKKWVEHGLAAAKLRGAKKKTSR